MRKIKFLVMILMTMLLCAGFAACSDDDDEYFSKYPFVGKTYDFETSWGATSEWHLLITFDSDTTFYFRTENFNGNQGEGNETPEHGKFTIGDNGYGIYDISMPSYRSGFRNYRITLYGNGTFSSDYKSVDIPTFLLFNSGNRKHSTFTFTLLED